jgi:hypothetical protein
VLIAVAAVHAVSIVTAQTPSFTPVGSIPIAAQLIRAQGERAYLAVGAMLSVADISNPAAPEVLGTYTFSDTIWGFRIVGGLAYVAADRSGLAVLDVSGTGTPTLRGSLKTPGQAKSVSVASGMALVTDTLTGLDFVDVTNPAKPALLGSGFLDGFSTDVVIQGSWAYAADRPTGFYLFDLSNKGSFEPVSSLQTGAPNNNGRAQLEVLPEPSDARRTVLLANGGPLQFFDVSDPASPAALSSFRTPGAALRVAVKDRRVYVADGAQGLQVVDLTMPTSPRIVGSFKTESPARDVAIAGQLVLVALGSGQVQILREGT